MREFWVSSGHHLTHRTACGELAVTDELALAFLARPELLPPAGACDQEQRLHQALLEDPRRPVDSEEIDAIADPDAQENWRLMLEFRARLFAAPSVEAAYRRLVREAPQGIPPLFVAQLTHLILRNALDDCADPFVLRAAELFFRPQRASRQDGALLLADAETVEQLQAGRSPLAAIFGQAPDDTLDVMDDTNAWTYWSRSDAFTMALDLATVRSRLALASAIAAWVHHLLGIDASVEPVARIDDQDWRWFVGLDRQGSEIGNAMWLAQSIDQDAMSRVLALFRLEVTATDLVEPKAAGHPVYLLSALERDNMLRMKPQNLVVGLPLRADALPL
ncbi:MAG: DUF6352 family protein [Acetobacteraceae bacterium]